MDIVTPCHGEPLQIYTVYEGGYLGSDVPDEINCPADKCYNSWNRYGVAETYNVYPNREEQI